MLAFNFRSESEMSRDQHATSPKSQDWSHFLVHKTPGAVITADKSGRITEFNPAAAPVPTGPGESHRQRLKYSPPGSTVWLKARIEDPAVRFAVKDQGPGISPGDLAHLFESFYRGQGVSNLPGFGLGLATVKRIIDAHGGRIWMDTALEKGSTFYVTFPLPIKQFPAT